VLDEHVHLNCLAHFSVTHAFWECTKQENMQFPHPLRQMFREPSAVQTHTLKLAQLHNYGAT